MNDISKLDSEELLHLSLKSMESNNHDTAIIYLKRALELAPENANIQYLLAAEYAEIGMFDRAKEGMQKAIEINPDMGTTRFQLGLLHITSGDIQKAEDTWEKLSELGENHPLYLFKCGLIHLAKDEFNECHALLTKGIESNNINPALNNDMRRMLTNIEDKITDTSADSTEVEQPETDNNTESARGDNHILLSNYKN